MTMTGLCLHTGAHSATREEVEACPTPAATRSHVPVPHKVFLDALGQQLNESGLRIVEEAHGLWKDGARYFGLLRVQNGTDDKDFGIVIGARNSHDKAFKLSLAGGAKVFVCDNLSFNGEAVVHRKHTTRILADLPSLVGRMLGKLATLRVEQQVRFDAYRQAEITDEQASHILIRALENHALPVTDLPTALKEWRNPSHPEFAAGGLTAWRLHNGLTESLRGNLTLLPKRTMILNGIIDAAIGLNVQKATEPQHATAG